MRLLSVMVAGAAFLGATACSRGDGATTTTSASTVASVDSESFRNDVQTICAEVSNELRDAAPQNGASPASAATALGSMVEVNRDGVDRLRAIEAPPQLAEAFDSWLDLVEETARYLEVGSLALRAGDDTVFPQALRSAEDAGVRASAAAQELELPACAFSG